MFIIRWFWEKVKSTISSFILFNLIILLYQLYLVLPLLAFSTKFQLDDTLHFEQPHIQSLQGIYKLFNIRFYVQYVLVSRLHFNLAPLKVQLRVGITNIHYMNNYGCAWNLVRSVVVGIGVSIYNCNCRTQFILLHRPALWSTNCTAFFFSFLFWLLF